MVYSEGISSRARPDRAGGAAPSLRSLPGVQGWDAAQGHAAMAGKPLETDLSGYQKKMEKPPRSTPTLDYLAKRFLAV